MDAKYKGYAYRELLKARKAALDVEYRWLASINALEQNLFRNDVANRKAAIRFSPVSTSERK